MLTSQSPAKVAVALSLAFIANAIFGCGSATETGEIDVEEAKQQIKSLLPSAAGMPYDEFRMLAEGHALPSIDEAENQPLSFVLLALRSNQLDESPEKLHAEFHYTDVTPRPSEIAKAMSVSQDKGYASVIQPAYIDTFTCKVDGVEARGTVSFALKNSLHASVHYAACHTNEGWRIVEFSLPAHQTTTKLADDGKWKAHGPGISTVLYVNLPVVAGLPPREFSANRVVVRVAPDYDGDAKQVAVAIGAKKTLVADLNAILVPEIAAVAKQQKIDERDVFCAIRADRRLPTGVVQEVIARAMESGLEQFHLVAQIEFDHDELSPLALLRTGEIQIAVALGGEIEELESIPEAEIEKFDTSPLEVSPVDLCGEPSGPPLRVRVMADAQGELMNVTMNGNVYGNGLHRLRNDLINVVFDADSDQHFDVDVEIDADYELQYEDLLDVLSMCAGYLDADGRWVPIVKSVRLASRRPPV